jgi:hypothetical protein
MKKISFILLAIVFVSCRNDKFLVLKSKGITILDSLHEKGVNLSYDPEERMAYFPVYYNGPIKDTIVLGKTMLSKYALVSSRTEYDSIFSIKDLSLFVDTNLKMIHQSKFYSELEGEVSDDSISSINAFGFVIKNRGKFRVHLGIMGSICSMVRQVKNDYGAWSDMEIPTFYFCGTGASQVILQGNEMIIGKMMRYTGDVIKECRLKLLIGSDSIFSNTFIDSVNTRQLTDTLRQIQF